MVVVAYTPTRNRGMSTPSETIRTATSHGSRPAAKAAIWYGPITQWDDAAIAKHLKSATAVPALKAVHAQLAGLKEWKVENVHQAIEAAAAAIGEGMGKVAQPLRVALTGTQVSPSIDHTVYLAGRERALQRVEDALARAGA